MTSSSMKDLLQEYHRLAADTLLGGASNNVTVAILEAAENAQVERLQKLLSEHPSLVDAHHTESGDTPLIAAARNGHKEVVDLLLSYGADVTLENDCRDSVLDVAGSSLRRHILTSIDHEDRSMSNAKALLQSAWLGDAVSVKRCLSGSHYLDVNSSNRDGLTPLLLVTKDVSLFTEVQNAMETQYNPVEVLQELIAHHADVNQSDQFGRSPLHLIASSAPSVHATKMVSLLLQNGSMASVQDSSSLSPLHVASSHGHVTVIVALVEEGGTDVNLQAGDTGDTPLMLSVRGGHNEAARYLLSKGADVTIVTDSGDSAMSVANSPTMKRMIKEAWTEQSQQGAEATSPGSDNEDNEKGSLIRSPQSLGQSDKLSFFLTDRHISRSLDFEVAEKRATVLSGSAPSLPQEVPENEEREGCEQVDNETREREGVTPHPSKSGGVGGKTTKRKGRGQTLKRRRNSEGTGVMVKADQREVGYESADEAHTRQDTQSPARQPLGRPERQEAEHKREEGAGQKGGAGRGRKTTSKATSHMKPSNMRSLHVTSRRSSHDSHNILTNRGSHDNHMTGSSPCGREQLFPEVFTPSSTPSSKPLSSLTTTPSHRHDYRLPSINLKNMKAVAVVAVDTKEDNFRVHRFGGTQDISGRESPIQRSHSLMNFRRGKPGLGKKGYSTGSIPCPHLDTSRNTTKTVLLPKVVVPQFGVPAPSVATPQPTPNPRKQPVCPHRGGSGRPRSISASHGNPINLASVLSIVNEDSESTVGSPSLLPETLSDQSLLSVRLPSSEESTLRASSQSDFEVDSLERKNGSTPHVIAEPPLLRHHSQLASTPARPSTLHSSVSIQHALPATVDQFYELTRQTSNASHAPSTHTVVNYAVQEGSVALSPIWDQTQFSRSQSEDGTASEYITSFVGSLTETPDAPNPETQAPGSDSGQGGSTDEERVDTSSASSASSASETEPLVVDTHCLKWKKGRLLGKGAYGKVWEGLLDSAKLIAVKEVELDITGQRAQSQYEKLRIEVEILRSLRHRNVVSYLGTSIDDCMVYIFMEFISGGSLQSILKRFGPLDDRTNSHYTRQIVRALNYLHSNGIVHRDIKGANVMVTSRGVIKLIDFGCAKQSCQDISGEMCSVRGTPYWMAPEVVCGDGYGRKSDIWSLGCTVHEMATSKPPWAEHPPEAAIFQIGMGRPIPKLPGYLSDEVIAFIHRCVVKDQLKRPGANELLEDPFLTKFKKKKK